VLDPPCLDDMELEERTVDEVVEEIRRNELYMSQKSKILPRPTGLDMIKSKTWIVYDNHFFL